MGAENPFEEMLRLQSKFQQNLTQATMTYLRQLQGVVGPVTPGTLVDVVEGKGVNVSVQPGKTITFEINVENLQRVHSLVTPMLSPLVNDRGVTWFAEVETTPTSKLLATDEIATFTFSLNAPEKTPVGVFRGACLIYGCNDGVIPISVVVDKGAGSKPAAKSKTATAKKPKKAPAKSKASKSKTTSKKAGEKASA